MSRKTSGGYISRAALRRLLQAARENDFDPEIIVLRPEGDVVLSRQDAAPEPPDLFKRWEDRL